MGLGYLPFIPRNLNLRIKPTPLPQERLDVPSFNNQDLVAGTERIDPFNKVVVGQEFYVYSTVFNNFAWTATGATSTIVIPTDPDGDFWCSNIVSKTMTPTGGVVSPPWIYVSIKDTRTGYQLFNPSVQLGVLNKQNFFGAQALFSNALSQTSVIQPYCFTRDGGISVTLTALAKSQASFNMNVYFAFHGWKEYANAAR